MMGRIFLYLCSNEPLDIPPIAASRWQHAVGIVVFQNSAGRVGFDEDESTTLLNALLEKALLLDWTPAPEPHNPNPQTNRAFVRRHAGHGLFALVEPSEELQNDTVQLQRLVKQRRANEVRAKLGRPQLPLPATRLNDWGAPQAKPSLATLELLCKHTRTTCLWKHNEWGIYATALSEHQTAIEAWARSANDTHELTIVGSARALPQW